MQLNGTIQSFRDLPIIEVPAPRPLPKANLIKAHRVELGERDGSIKEVSSRS